jgi:hypothetical protein
VGAGWAEMGVGSKPRRLSLVGGRRDVAVSGCLYIPKVQDEGYIQHRVKDGRALRAVILCAFSRTPCSI